MRHEACPRLTGMSAPKILLIMLVLVAGVAILPLCGSGIGADVRIFRVRAHVPARGLPLDSRARAGGSWASGSK
jgi:hypothetical protein